MIDIKVDTRDATRWLDDVQRKQIPFATAVALTRTAALVEKALVSELTANLDRPSPYTQRSTFKTSAKKTALYAEVGIKDKKPAGGTAPAVLLREHFTGGQRGFKPMERAIAAIPGVPPGVRVVPGSGMPLNAYGNPKRAAVKEVIGALRSGMNVHKKRISYGIGQHTTTAGYFIAVANNPRTKHLPPGIYRRYGQAGRALEPVFLFVSAPSYRKRFDLPALAQRVVSAEFQNQFRAALSSALSSAR